MRRIMRKHLIVGVLALAVVGALVFCELRIAFSDAAAREDSQKGKINLKNITGAVVREAWNSDDEVVFIYRSEGKSVRILLKTDYLGEWLEREMVSAGEATVTLTAKLTQTAGNFGEFDYRKHLLCHDIEYVSYPSYKNVSVFGNHGWWYYFFTAGPETLFSRIRGAIEVSINKYLGEKYSGYVMSVMTGYKGRLSAAETGELAFAGFSHLAAVSGSHIAFVTKPFEAIVKKLPIKIRMRKLLLLLPIGFLWIAAGMSPSVTRAALTSAISVVALCAKRPCDSVNALSLAAVIQLAFNPFVIYNTGFLLSYGAAFSMAVIFPALKKIAGKKNSLLDSFLAGIAVNLGLAPAMIYMFGGISLAGLFLNAVAAKAAGLLCVGGYAVFILDAARVPEIIIEPLARVIRGCGLFFVSSVEKIAELEHFPFRIESSALPVWLTVFYYVLILWLCIGKKFTMPALAGLACTVALFVIPWKTYVKISYLDVGQASCTLIRTSGGVCGLIDTGDGSTDIGEILAKNGIRKLNFVVITHGHEDHCGGLEALAESTDIDVIFVPENAGDLYCTDIYTTQKYGMTIAVNREYSIALDHANTLTLLESAYDTKRDDENNGSIIAILSGRWGNAIIPGDAETEELDEIMNVRQFEKCVSLELPHHGSSSSLSEKLYCQTSPDYVIISVGNNNSYGHPHKSVLNALEECGIEDDRIYRTDKLGEIDVVVGTFFTGQDFKFLWHKKIQV